MTRSARLGQNFLHDANIARRIVDLLPPGPGPLLEIGPGKGILSELLLEKIPPGHLTLVEFDPDLARKLRERFADGPRILEKSILEVDLAAVFPAGPVGIIGNLPYHISKPLVDWFIAQHPLIGEAVLMLQKDFVDKLLAPCGGRKYNAQSVAFQLLFAARRCFDVPAGAFAPKPKVISTVIAARPLAPVPGIGAGFYPFVRRCFAERRKTLWNNLAPHAGSEALAAVFATLALPQNVRAEQLSPPNFVDLWLALAKTGMDRAR